MSNAEVRNVVLVHGAWVDGSGWQDVHEELTRRGFQVSVVQHPTAWASPTSGSRWPTPATSR